MKHLLTIAITLMCLTAQAGNEGKGGGGTNRSGRPQTFYSAKIVTGATPLKEDEIPQLTQMSQQIHQMPYLTPESKAKILDSLLPTENRQYFKVLDEYYDKETENRLKAEYARITKQDPQTLVLFAVTETTSKATYLLPSFYALSNEEQKAILGHEAYWISNPQATYKMVLDVEYAYQAYFENPSDFNAVERLVQLLGTDNDNLKFVIEYDRDSKSLEPLLQNGSLAIKTLLSEQYFNCMQGTPSVKCNSYAYDNLFRFKAAYPKSKLLSYLLKKFDSSQKWQLMFGSTTTYHTADNIKGTTTFQDFTIRLDFVCNQQNSCGLATKGQRSYSYNSRGNGAIAEYIGQFIGGYRVNETEELVNMYFAQR